MTYNMCRALTLVVLAVGGVNASTSAAGASGPESTITVEIMAAESSWTKGEYVGHAFMCVAIQTGASIKEECYGFYPKDGKGLIAGPGVVVDEVTRNPERFGRIAESFKREISEDQRRAILQEAVRWNGREFSLNDQNCIDFVRDVAKKLGWKAPKRIDGELPIGFVKRLADENK